MSADSIGIAVTGERFERIAHNEARFRAVNEGLRAHLARLPTEPQIAPFICECAVASCAATIELSLARYESVRAHSRRFLVLPGHEIPDAEDVIERGDDYVLVEKKPEAVDHVDQTDPRRPLP